MAHLVSEVTRQPHHDKGKVCSTRAKYREGRKDTVVKVYTINQESCFLMIQNVPSVGAGEELKALCEQYGFVENIRLLGDYPGEEFTETYLAKYDNYFAARTAKKNLDDRSFFGGILHVCYAPEFEAVQDTKKKLAERRKYVASKTRLFQQNEGNTATEYKLYQKRKDDLSCNENQVKKQKSDSQFTTYIWAGKEYTIASSTDNQEKQLEREAEVAIRYEEYRQKQNANIRAQDTAEQQDSSEQWNVSCSSDITQQNTCTTSVQHFIPRQLSRATGQNSSRTKLGENKVQTHTQEKGSEMSDGKNRSYSYDETMSDIRKKLSSLSGANLTVNLKGKR